MSDTKKKNSINIPVVAAVILLVIAVGSMYGFFKTFQLKSKMETVITDLVKANKESSTNLKLRGEELDGCRAEMDSLAKRLEGIKNADDLLKRDIFLYIDKKFQIIPRTVARDIAEQILIVSKKENVSAELVVGIIQVESGFNPMAISKKNGRGLMQVMPEWSKKFNLKKVSDLHDIDTNIQCGINVLKIHIEEGKGSISKGLYYYVGKSDSYAGKVYEAMGKFVAFRSTIDDEESDIDINGNGDQPQEKEDNQTDATVEGAESSNN